MLAIAIFVSQTLIAVAVVAVGNIHQLALHVGLQHVCQLLGVARPPVVIDEDFFYTEFLVVLNPFYGIAVFVATNDTDGHVLDALLAG